MAFLTLEQLQVSYDTDTPVLRDFSLEIQEGELISFLGPSGCGKTTTLKTIAGFLMPDKGKIFVKVDGRVFHYCNSKCQKNFNMGRHAKNIAWTPTAHKLKEKS